MLGKNSNNEQSNHHTTSRMIWLPIILASIILMITMGIRQTVGLFVHPIVSTTTMNIAEVSMALAIGQLMWGVFQPIFGAWADKKGPLPVLVTGALLLTIGQFVTIFSMSFVPLALSQGLLSPADAAAGSFSVLIGVVATRLPASSRSVASGIINAGGSLGQFLLVPIVQIIIHARNYAAGLLFLGVAALVSIIPSWFLCKSKAASPVISLKPDNLAPPVAKDAIGLKKQLSIALRDRSYILLHLGFFTCGFHVAFLVTHLPGEIGLCGHSASVSAISLSLIGLCNIVGSIVAGVLGKKYKMKHILAVLYASRALMIAIYLMSPKTELTFYIFAISTGFTWLATVPPNAGIVGKLFGTRYLATLFGLTLLTHQVGGFLGAWFGGLAIQYSGNLLWVWYLDIALALIAAIVNLPIKEETPNFEKNS